MYLKLRDLDKSVFRATFATSFLIDGAIRLGSYAVISLVSLAGAGLSPGRTAHGVAGLYLGGRLQMGWSENAFVRFIQPAAVRQWPGLLLK